MRCSAFVRNQYRIGFGLEAGGQRHPEALAQVSEAIAAGPVQ
jgi:hypothetical protein